MKRILFLLACLLISIHIVIAQEQIDSFAIKRDLKYQNWFNKSPDDDQIYGAEVNKAYELLLKDKKSVPVIVAVIDGGIDIHHEDLKDNIWLNTNEIPDNNVDDDQNGYIDDLHGWNFLGNSKGENIAYENLEITRIYKQYNSKFKHVKANRLSKKEKEMYLLYKQAKTKYEKEIKMANMQKSGIERFRKKYETTKYKISNQLDGNEITTQALDSLKQINKKLKKEIKFLYPFVQYGFSTEIINELDKQINEALHYHLNLDYNPRAIIADDVNDMQTPYGNNNVYGPEAFHGTFVAGIIAAKRNNEKGIDGIAGNVQIMGLKVVPNGDERDKDVAKAIRYAVDNGARVINMSFGKDLSPQKQLVDDAIQYAEEKGVLLVHAAGNDGLNIDQIKQYPTKNINENKKINTWITVGASTINKDSEFAANFTNYGKTMVDLFAPGVNVKSLAPENKYEIADGTSFSSPMVSGVAALIFSYYPELSAQDIKDIILKSAYRFPEAIVNKPGDYSKRKKKVHFTELSVSGGIVSAYKALQMAENYSKYTLQ